MIGDGIRTAAPEVVQTTEPWFVAQRIAGARTVLGTDLEFQEQNLKRNKK